MVNKFICEYCLDNFKTSTMLLKHKNTSKRCLMYKNVLFVCKFCNYSTIGIKNIENHMINKKCIAENLIIESDDYNDYIIIEEEYKEENEPDLSFQNEIIKLRNMLHEEKIKNSMLTKIIEENINTKFHNTIQNVIIENTNEPIKVENGNDTDTNSIDNDNKQPQNPYKNFKNLKNYIDIVSEPDSIQLEMKIKNVDNENYRLKQNFKNLEHCKMIFENEFNDMKESRTYVKQIENIKNARKNLLGAIDLNSYIKLLQEHNKNIRNMLELKGHQLKKINTNIFKSLSGLEARLLQYDKYYEIPMDIEDFTNLKSCLEIHTKSYTYYTPFVFNDFIKQFYNYGTILIPIKTCIETYIFNKYNLNNVVYIPIKQSNDEDPYSYYILDGIIKNKRFWKLDNRLSDLGKNIKDSLKPYLCNIFRELYKYIFNDNDFRETFIEKMTFVEVDVKQLLNNFFIINDIYSVLRKIIKEKATYIPTENDKVNFFRDDPLIRKHFANKKDNIIENVKLLFDNITAEQCKDFYIKYSY